MENKSVLIALDYNTNARKVAETGYKMARAMNAEVYLLHVLAEPTYYSSSEYSPVMGFNGFGHFDFGQAITMEELRIAAREFLDKSKQYLGGEAINTLLKEGDPADAILEAATKLSVAMIVMGTHGRTGLDKLLMGSVAEKVLRQSSAPLFIIPTREEKKD